ncbi:Phytoene desaturase [Lachnellula willkommii]|uniref:Phytoene desaturase n=1 Tax=Lachnellula willkommii TaxID=215461 RepID=A0A559MJL6_9HELO|nr:Phytoene desaturase [Lachnellula willkommii]
MASKPKQKTAIVVGAGVGGIATAARLASAGFSVTILEKNSFTGGRCSLLTHEGYRFDQGPSLLLLPGLFAETFADLNTSLSAEDVKLLKCDPNYNMWFGDGEKPSFLRHLFALHPFESIYSRASKYFYTERLRRVFTFGSMYMGMSPFDAPGTYSLLQYTELAEGIWYPVGGFHAVVAAIVRICERLGVDIRLNTPVSRVLLSSDGKTATGVLTEAGETLTADVVVINADLVYAYNNLLAPTSYSRSLQTRQGSCSSISFYWSLSRKVPELSTHNIFLADEYRESFDAIFDRQSIPREPSFYVNVPSRIDPSAAPEGKDSIVVLVPVGHLLNSSSSSTTSSSKGLPKEELNWPALIASTRASILSVIQSRTHCDALEPLITHEMVNDPITWEDTFNLDKGSILGLSHSFFNVLAFRPSTRAKELQGCYFVGASTHPGTGVPIVLAGAKVTTEQILGDLGMEIPWAGRVEGKGKGKGEIDRVRGNGGLISDLGIWMLAIVVLVVSVFYINSGLVVTWDWDRKRGWGSGRV